MAVSISTDVVLMRFRLSHLTSHSTLRFSSASSSRVVWRPFLAAVLASTAVHVSVDIHDCLRLLPLFFCNMREASHDLPFLANIKHMKERNCIRKCKRHLSLRSLTFILWAQLLVETYLFRRVTTTANSTTRKMQRHQDGRHGPYHHRWSMFLLPFRQ